MNLLADVLLLSAAIAAAVYCRVLAMRLKALGDSGRGLGGAIANLDQQVESIRDVLEQAKSENSPMEHRMNNLVVRAEQAATRLEILLASLHDLPVSDAEQNSHNDLLSQKPEQILRPETNGLAATRQSAKIFSRTNRLVGDRGVS